MFLCLDCLMQSVAPAAAFHDTACLLVYNLDLAVLDDVFVVDVEHGVCLEQLLQGVHALTLEGIVGVYLVLLLDTGLVVQCLVSLDLGHHACDIWQDEKGLVLDLRGEPFVTLIGQVDAVHLLVNNEIEGLYCLGHTTVVVLHVDVLGTEESCLDAWLGEVFDEGLVLRQCLETAEE